jgi:hypothetical protein
MRKKDKKQRKISGRDCEVMNMGISYRNLWSLNIDEAIVTGYLRNKLGKKFEIFMPLNAQLKGIDLVAISLEKHIVKTIQVKGSRAYKPTKKELERYGEGSGSWNLIPESSLINSRADFFIFLLNIITKVRIKKKGGGREIIEQHYIIIPTEVLKKIKSKFRKTKHKISCSFWINPHKKQAYIVSNKNSLQDREITEYLDDRGINILKHYLKKGNK